MVESVRQIRKALVGAVAAAIVTAVSKWVDLDVVALEAVLDAVVVGVLVWAVPNAQPYVEHDNA
jgi:hypothetical protein